MSGLKFFSAYFLLVILFGCSSGPQRVYDHHYDLPERQWKAANILKFNFEIQDTKQAYDFLYNIRHTHVYKYHNLYIKYLLIDANGKKSDSLLQNITLFDPKTGRPLGDGSGDIYEHLLAVPEFTRYTFKKKGNYSLHIEQYMRLDPLPEIVSFGVRIQASAP